MSACLSRRELCEMTSRLALTDTRHFSDVSEATIKSLELGWSRPRPKTARTLASALNKDPHAVFTSGIDDSDRKSTRETQ
ncbi:MAG: hypothetical protein JNK63_08550 [Chthonomonas sp.]|nr:hypothetical protein [Chthonomonas sp.]